MKFSCDLLHLFVRGWKTVGKNPGVLNKETHISLHRVDLIIRPYLHRSLPWLLVKVLGGYDSTTNRTHEHPCSEHCLLWLRTNPARLFTSTTPWPPPANVSTCTKGHWVQHRHNHTNQRECVFSSLYFSPAESKSARKKSYLVISRFLSWMKGTLKSLISMSCRFDLHAWIEAPPPVWGNRAEMWRLV